MADPFPTYHERLGFLSEDLTAAGGLGLLVLDLSPFGVIEDRYGSGPYQEVRRQAFQLVQQQQGKLIRSRDLLAIDEPAGLNLIVFVNLHRTDSTSPVAELKTRRDQLAGTLLPMISRLAQPYLKVLPRLTLGQAVAVHNPLVQPGRIVARGIREALEHGRLQRSLEDHRLRERLQEILVRERLLTAYQPIVEVQNAKVFGYEALSRGAPGSGLEHADMLFQAAQENDLLVELDRLCRRKAFLLSGRLPAWTKVFVNILPTAIRDPEFKGKHLINFLERAKIPPARIVIEITERLVIENYSLFQDSMAYYTNLGIAFAIDDVGSGYSGLEAIAGLRPAYLKIDMSLIRDLHSSITKREMVQAIYAMGKGIEARVIAEGIQTEEELRVVESIGVELGQGYLFGRPDTAYGP